MQLKKLVSICVPVFNEEDSVEPFYRRVCQVISPLTDRYDFEILFTDNHSTDRTFEHLSVLARDDHRIRVLRFSRNFGFQKSILTNYKNTCGDAAIQLDCDLQDPPELIVEFLRLWEEGYKVVYGVRRFRHYERAWLHWARRLFYRLIDFLSEDELPHDAGDFRLIDRCILDELHKTRDQQPYLRGMIASMGFAQMGVPYDRSARVSGTTKFSLTKLIGLGLDGILNHSIIPLRIATVIGAATCFIALLGSLYYVVARLFFREDWPTGLASSSILLLFSIGMNAFFLGIIGEYIGRIYKNVKRTPLTIVESVIDSANPPHSVRRTPPTPATEHDTEREIGT